MLLAQLKKIFGEEPLPRGVLEDREPFELATAALLLELARADFSENDAEVQAIRHLLQKRFELTDDALNVLMVNAARRADKAVSLHELTHRMNRELPEEDKLAIVEMLWHVSHADGRIDKHEEHLIRRIAGLLHISDRDRVRLKLKVVVDSDR
ncbi:MAG TPA: TerB family tellurite resistance protein [Steroidobacter sp.]|uniref:tellurite resistance TerB family protein n=1 Tax=Steroidobacter sp. TaxID=1978227 RepID=UPI002EDB6876